MRLEEKIVDGSPDWHPDFHAIPDRGPENGKLHASNQHTLTEGALSLSLSLSPISGKQVFAA